MALQNGMCRYRPSLSLAVILAAVGKLSIEHVSALTTSLPCHQTISNRLYHHAV